MRCLALLCLLCVPLPGMAQLAPLSFDQPHMGTRFQITMYAPDEATASKAAKAAFARIAELDGIMSDYRPASELMRLCAKAGGDSVPVSPELFFVLDKAQEVSRFSDGAFDVTVGPVVRLWRLARRTQRLPDPEQLAKARALVGFRNVKLDPKKRTVQLLQPGIQLDLGGIGKGYAADEAHKVLRAHGITRAIVAAGGDVTVTDPAPDARAWTVAIYPLEPEKTKSTQHILLENASISTSGDFQQFTEIDGTRYSHIVDPRTGIGLVGRMSASVIAPTGTQADSLTKVLAVLGPEKAFPILEKVPGVTARLARLTDKGLDVQTMKNFPKPIVEPPSPK